jgi:SNF2 family DNA or RNA helicase
MHIEKQTRSRVLKGPGQPEICVELPYHRPMLVLHAGLLDEELLVWGEMPPATGKVHSRFASRNNLKDALAEAGSIRRGQAYGRGRVDGRVVAWLPTALEHAVPSTTLIAPKGELGPAPDKLAAYSVEAFAFDAPSMLALVRACAGQSLLAPGLAIGRDLAYWPRLARFAAMLVVERRYVPSLEAARIGRRAAYRARWRPRLDAAGRAELAMLAMAMPGACRALGRDVDGPPLHDPLEVARQFVDAVVDHLVRTAADRVNGAGRPGETPHDQWLRALANEDPDLSTTATGVRALAAQVVEWVRETTRDDDAEYRLCLRLEEPLGEQERWSVRYLLQSHADPSLLVDLQTAWKTPRLRRAFLEAIGKAAGFSPSIEATLRAAQPAGYELDDAGAYAFLTREAALFEGAGYGILFPAWWTANGTKAKLTLRARAKQTARGSGMGLGLDQIVSVNWTVALGDKAFNKRELDELARLKAPLINVRGQWVVVDAAQIRAAIELIGGGDETMRLRELVTMAATGRGPQGTLAVERVAGAGSLGALLDRLAGRAAFEEQPIPKSLHGTLRPYQARGYSWLSFLSGLGLGACLADDMGLGKTITTLALITRDWANDPSAPVLLVCPTSVIGNWQREIASFTPDLPFLVHHGGERARDGRLLPRKGRVAVVLTSYGIALRDRDLLASVRWRGIVLDEAQNVKNAENKQSQAVRTLESGYRVALTGTPIENHVGDLWSLMEFLNPGLLGSAASFRREFQIPITAYADPEAEARLKRTTAPFVLRRLKSDPAIISDLPKKLEARIFCQLTKEQASLYAAVLRDVEQQLKEAAGIERRGLVLATLTKLKQICNHPAHFLHDNSALRGRSGKLARVAEMLEEVRASGEHALIFTQYTDMAVLLQRYLQETTGREVLYLHGGLSTGARDRMVARFQESDDAPAAFILSLRAGGTGLNLTRANHVFHFDRWWNPAVENQASDRAYRIGQRKNVYIHRLICAGTVEEKIDAMLERKGSLANRLVRSGEAGLTELSNAQLRELFALSDDAVIEE